MDSTQRPQAIRSFTARELGEVFPANPIREVDFEIRFTPRLRVQAEMWRLQEQVIADYPEVGLESAVLPSPHLSCDPPFKRTSPGCCCWRALELLSNSASPFCMLKRTRRLSRSLGILMGRSKNSDYVRSWIFRCSPSIQCTGG